MSEGANNEKAINPADAPRDTLLYSLLRIAAHLISRLFLGFRCWGSRNVPVRGGMLLVCTHQSHIDPVLYGVDLRRQISFFAKAELFENRFFGAFIRNLHAFPVRRGQADVGAMKEAIRRVKAGHVLLVFAEGTRSVDGNIKPLEAGIGLIARRAGVPVVPAVIDGSWKVLPRGAIFPRPQRVGALYGKPMRLDGLKPAEIVTLLEKTLREMQVELRRRMAE